MPNLRLVLCVIAAALPAVASKPPIHDIYQALPMRFEVYAGQTPEGVRFVSRGEGYSALFSRRDIVIAAGSDRLRMRLIGANPASDVTGLDPLPGHTNFLIGDDPTRWRTGVPAFGRVRYRQVYPGVDMVFYGNERRLEYDLILAPHTHPEIIRLRFDGARRLRINSAGELVLEVGGGEILHHRPLIYQQTDAGKTTIAGRYVMRGRNEVSFAIGEYDHSRPLVIDPSIGFASYLGGGGAGTFAEAFAVVADSAGNIYVAGGTDSPRFPVQNALQSTPGGATDIFITKISPAHTLVYSTYIGGSGYDFATDLAIDAAGNAYLAGSTESNNFPRQSPLQSSYGGSGDAFVLKLNTAGNALVYSTYLGGSAYDSASGIATDIAGNAYVTGTTLSANFPLASAFDSTRSGHNDAFVTKLNPAGSALVYSTLLGGSDVDEGTDIAVDAAGSAYVTGSTYSADFPVQGAFQSARGGPAGENDAFVTKLSAAGNTLVYSSYLGGTASDGSSGIAVDSSGNAYVAGRTRSTNFPTRNPLQAAHAGGTRDAFVTKVNAAGNSTVYSTYLGGSGSDEAFGIAVNASGSATVGVDTTSTNFPLVNPIQRTFSGGAVAIASLNAEGSALTFSTYFGDGPNVSSADPEPAIAAAAAAGQQGFVSVRDVWEHEGNIYAVGKTDNGNLRTRDSLQPYSGGTDTFIVCIDSRLCSYALSPPGKVHSANTFLESVVVVVAPSGCPWSASTSASWLRLRDPNGIGPGSFIYGVDENTVAEARIGTINLQDQTHVVRQEGRACTYSLGQPYPIAFSSAGGAGGVTLQTDASCQWSANARSGLATANWITVTPFSGTGSATISYSTAANPSGRRQASIITTGGFFSIFQSQAPAANTSGTVSATGATTGVGGGSIASTYGIGMAVDTAVATAVPLPTELGPDNAKTTLEMSSGSIGPVAAPLFFVSDTQINFVVPWELAGQPQATLRVKVGTVTSPGVQVNLGASTPAIFSMNQQGTGPGAITIATTGELANNARPARRGEYISIYCSGLGDVTNRPASGAPARPEPLSMTRNTPTVTIGGITANVVFSGLAPGFVGLYQVNAQVPDTVTSGSAVPVVINIGGVASNTVTIAVQ